MCSREEKIRSLGLGPNIGWIEVPAVGLLGGILTLWNKDVFRIESIITSRHWICAQGSIVFSS